MPIRLRSIAFISWAPHVDTTGSPFYCTGIIANSVWKSTRKLGRIYNYFLK